ncbi:hypothetical protein [Streptomyces griseiscabiei]|uniref:Uncharacterized protein n=1 Tax=Streptomyces griseiscabiei TaxID=2993540 RepID=A0ABU4LJH1_9ACTN|nr:hypothetical protein [Streptomyces griseiscabiei]MDX2915959.1 hypothetical protein [Streptomyces griseiscabiei]
MTTTDTTTAALYAQALQDTIDDPGQCVVPWGVCPEHGGTLTCFNSWEYDRLDAPCPEPATHTVRADGGGQYAVCDGHAMTARLQITGGQVLPGIPA